MRASTRARSATGTRPARTSLALRPTSRRPRTPSVTDMPWWTVPVGVALGVALPVLTLSGMFWLGGEDWRFWRTWRDEWRDLRDRERESERNRPNPPT